MYQSLYRKYRPENFGEVVGQEVVVKTLKNAIKNNRISHAYLFTGPRGTGKTSIAKIFAKTINCENLNDLTPCNECVSCTQINNKQTVDILEIDAASNNGVDEIRELRNKANLVPTNGKYKVYIIDEVHMLTTGAFNALLKTLEEPPEHIVFILATTEPYKIPLTILSRCQRFDFKKINSNLMNQHLEKIAKEENIELEKGVSEEISRLSGGCLRDALSILDQVSAYSVEKVNLDDVHEINGTLPQIQLKTIIQSIIESKYDELFKIIDDYDEKGKNFVKLSEEIISFLRNVLLCINVPNYFKENYENPTIYNDIMNSVSVSSIIEYLKTFNEAINNMKKSNNPKLLFEIAIIQILDKKNKKDTFSTSVEKNDEITEKPSFEKLVLNSEKAEDLQEIKESDEIVQKKNDNWLENNEFSKETLENLNHLKNIRINNTLCSFNRKYLINAKDKVEEARNFIINPEYSQVAAIILDGVLKAASENNLIFVYQTEHISNEYNRNLIEIDQLLSKIFGKDIHSISTDIDSWEIIKKEFNNKEKKYEYIEEPNNLEEYLKLNDKNNTVIDNTFGELVEYN